MSVVVDANVVVALLIPDEHQIAARAHFEKWLDAGETLNAPAVLPYEVANVLARLDFEGTLSGDVTEIWRDLGALDLRLHSFDLTADGPRIATITSKLRRKHATDSAYVCLAERLGTTLWTLDGALARNAADVELPVQHVG